MGSNVHDLLLAFWLPIVRLAMQFFPFPRAKPLRKMCSRKFDILCEVSGKTLGAQTEAEAAAATEAQAVGHFVVKIMKKGTKKKYLRKTVTTANEQCDRCQVKGRTLIADKFVSKTCEPLNCSADRETGLRRTSTRSSRSSRSSRSPRSSRAAGLTACLRL